ncbi:unnamed protein product, partial [Durusdinium trenchii]
VIEVTAAKKVVKADTTVRGEEEPKAEPSHEAGVEVSSRSMYSLVAQSSNPTPHRSG